MSATRETLRRGALGAGRAVGAVLLLAALGKALNWQEFIKAFPRLAFMPGSLRLTLACGVVACELVLGFRLAFESRDVPVARAAFAVLAFFLAYSAAMMIPGADHFLGGGPECDCFMLKAAIFHERKLALARDGLLALASFAYLREIGSSGVSGPEKR